MCLPGYVGYEGEIGCPCIWDPLEAYDQCLYTGIHQRNNQGLRNISLPVPKTNLRKHVNQQFKTSILAADRKHVSLHITFVCIYIKDVFGSIIWVFYCACVVNDAQSIRHRSHNLKKPGMASLNSTKA